MFCKPEAFSVSHSQRVVEQKADLGFLTFSLGIFHSSGLKIDSRMIVLCS